MFSFKAHGFDNGSGVNTAGGAASAYLAHWNATRLTRFVEAATPLLTPEQRMKFAAALRHHLN